MLSVYLHPNESEKSFCKIQEELLSALKPQDAIERLWCDDIITLVWESHRLRRVKRVLLEAEGRGRLRGLLLKHEMGGLPEIGLGPSRIDRIMEDYFKHDEKAVQKVEQALAGSPVTAEDGVAIDHLSTISDMLMIDRAIEASDKRRDVLISNLYGRRRLLGKTDSNFDILE